MKISQSSRIKFNISVCKVVKCPTAEHTVRDISKVNMLGDYSVLMAAKYNAVSFLCVVLMVAPLYILILIGDYSQLKGV